MAEWRGKTSGAGRYHIDKKPCQQVATAVTDNLETFNVDLA